MNNGRFCPHCGNPVSFDDIFCENCGLPVGEWQEDEKQPTNEQNTKQVNDQSWQMNEGNRQLDDQNWQTHDWNRQMNQQNEGSENQWIQENNQTAINSAAEAAEKTLNAATLKKRNTGAVIGICAGCGIVAAVALALGVSFFSGKEGSASSNNLTDANDAVSSEDVVGMDNSTEAVENDNGTEADGAVSNADEEEPAADSNTDILTKLNVRDDILSAMNASKKLTGIEFAMASDGGYYYFLSYENFAYCYYNKDVTGLYCDASSDPIIVATMEDGSVYAGLTLIAEDCDIMDVAFKTHTTNIDAYMLGSDGQLYFFDPYNENDSGRYENYFEKVEGATNISAICRAQSYAIFFYADGGIATPGLFMSGGSAEWKDVDVDGWEGIVVAACAYDDDDDIYTIAGISADGTVYATGDYADEILAMGDLVYITMTDTASLIVGLTPEGTLKFAGGSEMVDYYNNLGLTDIAGVKAFEGKVWAIGTDGTVYELCTVENEDGETVASYTAYSTDGIGGEYAFRDYYMSASGEVYEENDTVWATSDKINAQTADPENILYYNALSTGEYNAGRSFTSSTVELDDNYQMALLDLNGDGQKELVLEEGNVYRILCFYDEEVSTSINLYGTELVYYQEPQVLLMGGLDWGVMAYTAGYLINGQYTQFLKWTEDEDGVFESALYTGEEELPYTDEEGESLREINSNYVSEAELEALKEMIFGDAAPETVTDFTAYSEENLESFFLE